MSIVKRARPEIQKLRPYAAAAQVDDTIRLNANEAPWTNSGENFRRPLNRYPEVRPTGIAASLAERYGCAPDNLIVTRGASEGIDLLIRIFCRSGLDSIVSPSPTFSMYRHYARVQGARLTECPTSPHDDFAIDVDQLLAACDDDTRLIFVCSPNNPTGNAVPRDDLVRLLDACREKSAVVVDEAYIEFSDQESAIKLLSTFDNLIVLRTLSKALAFAGARCGCVIAAPPVIDLLAAVQAPYALATPVVESVENGLRNESLKQADKFAREIAAARDTLVSTVARLSYVKKVWPSKANFFLVEVADAQSVLDYCADQGILLRCFGGELENFLRITVGSTDENRRLLETLAALDGA